MILDTSCRDTSHSGASSHDVSCGVSHGDIAEPSDEDLIDDAGQVVTQGIRASVSVGVAESCTGGLVCATITDIPGASAVLRGGVVSYAIPVKHDVLGVSQDIIDAPGVGVVSCPCACAMAEGARRILGCDYAVSITGIAGPRGCGAGENLWETVWFGLGGVTGVSGNLLSLFGRPNVCTKKSNACGADAHCLMR
jgi:nicotinamide-nucleotide amidase